MGTFQDTGKHGDHKPPGSAAFLQLAFRPFFLLGALFSILCLLAWAAAVTGKLTLAVYGGPLWWHIHEMLFGFVSAIVVGFLLTAVQTWTGQRSLRGKSLAWLLLLWLSARLLLFTPPSAFPWLAALIDLLFLPLAAVALARPVIHQKQWRNIIFVPILLAMAAANATMHWAAYEGDVALQYRAGNSMVIVVTLLMTIMAGRVLPMFTANGTQTERVVPLGWLEKASLFTMLLAVAASFEVPGLRADVAASCFFLAALTHALRAFRWRFWVTLKTPLVWSLHLSYWCIPLGLLLLGLSLLTPAVGSPAEGSTAVTHSQAIHTLTVGAMGMMILSMISRVSLGHTGRPLAAGTLMATAFAALFGAFLVRVFGVYWIDNYVYLIGLAALLWAIAYGCFVVRYLPILTTARPDGRPG